MSRTLPVAVRLGRPAVCCMRLGLAWNGAPCPAAACRPMSTSCRSSSSGPPSWNSHTTCVAGGGGQVWALAAHGTRPMAVCMPTCPPSPLNPFSRPLLFTLKIWNRHTCVCVVRCTAHGCCMHGRMGVTYTGAWASNAQLRGCHMQGCMGVEFKGAWASNAPVHERHMHGRMGVKCTSAWESPIMVHGRRMHRCMGVKCDSVWESHVGVYERQMQGRMGVECTSAWASHAHAHVMPMHAHGRIMHGCMGIAWSICTSALARAYMEHG
eukprot:364524-Chlamydomonas_euryale.AAC.4